MNKPSITITEQDGQRKFYSSSTLAFPQTTEYACAVEIHKGYMMPWIVKFSIFLIFVLYLVSLAAGLSPEVFQFFTSLKG